MFIIFLSIVFTTCILAAPAPPAHNQTTSTQWSTFKEDKTLDRFQSTLLNETFLPFLTECYDQEKEKSINDVCSRYFDAIVQFNSSSNYKVNVPSVIKLRDQTNTWSTSTTPFCEQNHTYPERKNFLLPNENDLKRMDVCGKKCLQDDLNPRPICKFLDWMGEELRKNSVSMVIGNSKLAVMIPFVSSTTLSMIVPKAVDDFPNNGSPPINELTSKSIDAAEQGKTTETIRADVIAEKPALNSAKLPIKIPLSKNVGEPIKIQEGGVAVDLDKQIEEKQPLNEGKEASAVDPKKQNEDKNSLVETPVAQNNQKQEKSALDDGKGSGFDLNNNYPKEEKQISEEAKDEIALATLNSSAQDPIKPVELPKEKLDNPDSGENLDTDTDEDPNENDADEYLKIMPDNEQNHSSKQEIINTKILATTTTNEKKDPFHEQSGSNFFTYFLVGMFLCIAMYVSYHNKSKILALVLEGRRGDKGRNGRRKHTAAYRKLDSNLEEAITSSARGRTTQIIY